MVKIGMHCSQPDEIPVTLVITMTLGEWKRLRGQLSSGAHPGWKISDAISRAMLAIESKIELEVPA